MKRLFLIIVGCCVAWNLSLAAAAEEGEEKSNANPEAGDIALEPSSGKIGEGDEITITFPRSMVADSVIDVAGQPAPFVGKPKLEGTFLWKSETEGVFTVTGVIADARYRLTLDPALKDATGKPFAVKEWSAEFTAPKFEVQTDFSEHEQLPASPQIYLNSTYSVKLSEAVEHIYYQDRDSHQRFPVEVVLADDKTAKATTEAREFSVEPRQPLPVGHTYDLVVNGLLDAKNRRPLAYLYVVAAGTTEPLKVEWIGAFNHALEQPAIRVKFNDEIDPAEATAANIRIEPAVHNAKFLADRAQVEITGDFDLKQKYSVTVSAALKGSRGYGLTGEAHWKATFRPKESCLIFPSSRIFARARNDLRFAFLQVNTPQVIWKLARIPAEKLSNVTARINEFQGYAIDPVSGKPIDDPRTGFSKQFQTELLIDALKLPVVATGNCDASSEDKEVRREIHSSAPTKDGFSGAYLLEATATLPDGRVVGNRAIICINDYLLTQKRTPTTVIMRVAKMSDGNPLSGVNVRAVDKDNIEIARATTDKDGMAQFSRSTLFPKEGKSTHLFIADAPTGPALQFADAESFSSGIDYVRDNKSPFAQIITDRNLYRPGQVIKMKGIVRDATSGSLTIPKGAEVQWQVVEGDGERVAGKGTVALSDYGGWEAEWTVPEKAKLGQYLVNCRVDGREFQGSTRISVEEYRVPLFSVAVEAPTPLLGPTAHAKVSSAYFHGAPNVGAQVHWKATWTASSEYGTEEGETSRKRFNTYAEIGPRMDVENEEIKNIEGDTRLDEHGFAELTCESPFKDNRAIGRATVIWKADITSADGQTLSGGDLSMVAMAEARLGVAADEKFEAPAGVGAKIDAVDFDDKQVKDVAVHAELFHVTTKSAKEQIGPFIYRYRNTDQFTKVASQDTKTPAEIVFPTSETGRYVVAVTAPGIKTPIVSDEATVTGEKPAELPVVNETTFKIEHRSEPFTPGEKAELTIQTPFAGVAWVSVETTEVLDTFLVPIKGNASRIEVPVKKEYAPNASVSVYLVKPGGDNELPRERFAYTELTISRPDRELKIEPHLFSATAKPGETVKGEIRVTSDGKPVGDADLVVFAVDDAVLTLGDWKLPEIVERFYPRNSFAVRTYQALMGYIDNLTKLGLTQKGFIIGGGGEEAVPNIKNVRKEFRTLAFWQGSLITGADGKASFQFTAPDNLTTYRIVAVGETKANQFGGDASQTVKISKPLLIDPALPRFLRDGDEIELRAVVRQNFTDDDQVTARCVTDASCKLVNADAITLPAHRDAPAVFRFKAKVADPNLAPSKIRFEASSKTNNQMSDAVEITLPVQPPTIVRRESVAGPFNGPQFDARKVMPEAWKRGRGNLTAVVSTSPWLPEIEGLPTILQYPHGCFEQISTKLLGYSLMANLLAYLPDLQERDAEYRATLERGMKQFADSVLSDGMLPYWPGGTTGNGFVSCQALWAVNESANAGFEPPPDLQDKLKSALRKVISGQVPASRYEKCFALFVLTQSADAGEFSSESHELYLHRNEGTDEDRALLAIALHRQNIMPTEKLQLLREIDVPLKERAFNPVTFTSLTRAEAIRAVAFDTIAPATWTKQRKEVVRDRMLKLMESSASLSTQENLWLLLAFKSMLGTEPTATLSAGDPAGKLSKNSRSAAWLDRKIEDPLTIKGLNQGALTFLMRAEYSTNELDTDRVDRGFKVERVVKNLTDSKRAGTADAPFKIGDQLLITYRINTRKLQNYVALEDALPSGLEVVNPNLALVGKFFELPATDPHDRILDLSYSELRDRVTLLYFDTFAPGNGVYSVLARATSAGTFRWPATQVVPMYDSRFSGLSPSSMCVISAE